MSKNKAAFEELLQSVRACRLCEEVLPHGINPVLQVNPKARILIAGQAPGRIVHESGIPFDDASGDRLRSWMGIDKETFYDPHCIAILPMSFCFPGTKSSGDLPPRPECAPAWRQTLLEKLPRISFTLLVGRYAIDWHMGKSKRSLVALLNDRTSWPKDTMPIPHPSPRNNIWLKKNPSFEAKHVPKIQTKIRTLLEL